MTLVSWRGTAPWNSNRNIGSGGAEYEWGMKKTSLRPLPLLYSDSPGGAAIARLAGVSRPFLLIHPTVMLKMRVFVALWRMLILFRIDSWSRSVATPVTAASGGNWHKLSLGQVITIISQSLIGIILSSVCPSVCLWHCVLWHPGSAGLKVIPSCSRSAHSIHLFGHFRCRMYCVATNGKKADQSKSRFQF